MFFSRISIPRSPKNAKIFATKVGQTMAIGHPERDNNLTESFAFLKTLGGGGCFRLKMELYKC